MNSSVSFLMMLMLQDYVTNLSCSLNFLKRWNGNQRRLSNNAKLFYMDTATRKQFWECTMSKLCYKSSGLTSRYSTQAAVAWQALSALKKIITISQSRLVNESSYQQYATLLMIQ